MINETMQDTQVGSLILEDFRVSSLSATVKRELFQILGLIVKRSPHQSQNIALTVQQLLFSELFAEVEKQKKPQIPIVIGTLKGITHLMHSLDPPPDSSTLISRPNFLPGQLPLAMTWLGSPLSSSRL